MNAQRLVAISHLLGCHQAHIITTIEKLQKDLKMAQEKIHQAKEALK